MSKTLATAVHLADESGVVHSFLPGEKPPKWASELITNPKAWDSAPEVEVIAEELAKVGVSDEDTPDAVKAVVKLSEESGVPKRNASTEAWRAYANANGFETDDDISRAEIIAALEADGIPTE